MLDAEQVHTDKRPESLSRCVQSLARHYPNVAVEIEDTAAQLLPLDRRQELDQLLAAQNLRGVEAVVTAELLVELETDAVIGALPPAVRRNHERNAADEVRGVVNQPLALP